MFVFLQDWSLVSTLKVDATEYENHFPVVKMATVQKQSTVITKYFKKERKKAGIIYKNINNVSNHTFIMSSLLWVMYVCFKRYHWKHERLYNKVLRNSKTEITTDTSDYNLSRHKWPFIDSELYDKKTDSYCRDKTRCTFSSLARCYGLDVIVTSILKRLSWNCYRLCMNIFFRSVGNRVINSQQSLIFNDNNQNNRNQI